MPEEVIYQSIGIDEISEPTDQIRNVIAFEGLQELADSIKEKGVIEPLIVLRKGEKFEIIAGHRRYLAAKMSGILSLPCIIRGVDEKEADFLKMHENYFRENINPVDEGKYFIRLHEKHGLAYNEIARLCTRSDGYVLNRVQLLQADEMILAALEGQQLSFSQALEISRSPYENVRRELLRVVIESGATTDTLRVMRHDYERTIRYQDSSAEGITPEARHYEEVKHLIICPACDGRYPVNQIYPISVCKTCYDNFVSALKGEKSG